MKNANVVAIKEESNVDINVLALALAAEWGWQAPPDAIKELAVEGVEARTTPSGQLFVDRGLISAERRDVLIKTKPADVQTITWFAQQDTNCSSIAEKLTALKSGLPFYDSLACMSLHEKMRDPAVIRRVEELDVALMMIESRQPVLVFSSAINLYKYRSMGRQERGQDAISRALGGGTPLLALGVRDDVSVVLKTVRSNDASDGPNDGQSIWISAANISPEGREFSRIIDHSISEGVSDVALIPQRKGGFKVRLRRNGRLMRPKSTGDSIKPDLAASMRSMLEKASGANPNNVDIRKPTDGQITYRSSSGDAFLRLSFIPTNHPGEFRNLKSVSIRILQRTDAAINLSKLNLADKVVEEIKFALNLGQGLVMVCGPTNSGKSTTVAGVIGMHIEMYGETKKRMSIENPIERFLEGVMQYNINNVEDFPMMLKAFKRHDPDLIWVGEVRDPETADMIVSSGASGNMGITTLHANDSIMGFDVLGRVIEPDKRYQYVESLALIISQRLVAELCPHCKQTAPPTKDEKQIFERYLSFKGMKHRPIPVSLHSANSKGCKECHEGYAGELPINEVLSFNRAVKDAALAVLEGRLINGVSPREIMEKERTCSLFDSGYVLLSRGAIDLRTLLEALPL